MKQTRSEHGILNLPDRTATRTLIHDQIFGYPALLPEWTFDMLMKHVHPEDRTFVEHSFGEAMALKAGWNFECRIIRYDGELRWIKAVGNHMQSSFRKHLWMSGLVQDITERKLAELELIRAKEKAEESEINLLRRNEEYECLNEELRQTNDELITAKDKAEESDRQ